MAAVTGLILSATIAAADRPAKDPGVRGGEPGAGGPVPGLTSDQTKFFLSGQSAFLEVDSVQGAVPNTGAGLGPRFNLDTCSGCHAQPAIGGTSSNLNPQVAMATKYFATNYVPYFVTSDGPIRESRFKYNRDGTRDVGVHAIFTVSGRLDAQGCNIAQPNYDAARATNNISFRIPTPVFGAGLIESITDDAILANMNSNLARKKFYGISGHENRSGNDGTITRLGWKAQNKSVLMFAGEAYNVEQGVTNELFTQERDETPGCLFNATPEDHTNFDAQGPVDSQSDANLFALFVRMLAPPAPATTTLSTASGGQLFDKVGCTLCHTPQMTTGTASIAALGNQQASMFSDLLVHRMGSALADDIIQGDAGPDEFRTAPLWGVGQRIFFLHDGRTKDLLTAIQTHRSRGSEANKVIESFNGLTESQKQSVLDFLRSL